MPKLEPVLKGALIELQKVSFAYRSGKGQALRDISVSARAGEFIAVIGANGSGKSTLARIMAGLLTPTAGQVSIDSMEATLPENKGAIRRKVGLCLQNPEHQLIASVVEEDVAFGPENLGLTSEEICRRVETALEDVNLSDLRLRPAHLLSGGEKQRLAIAGLLALNPAALVLDEPTSMLDPVGRREVLAVLRQLADSGKLIIMITHHMDEAARADRILVLNKGLLLMDDTPGVVLSHFSMLKKLGLASTEIGNLACCLEELGFSSITATSVDPIMTIEDLVEYLCRVLKQKN